MPVERVPVVHKFGIISHSQRLELQERLLKQSYQEAYQTRKNLESSKNVLEVTEEFVQQYNELTSLDDQEKMEDVARKMLERIKRRAGLKDAGSGKHVDLPVAWTELSQLAQCKGRIQEECLDVMITSLDQAPLEKAHIAALFFLAETTLYWLRTDAINQPYLRTGEIKLLKMGQLVFTRLFFHHMACQLQGQNEFKNRLFTYLDGFADCQEAYSPYPGALLSIRFINEVGKMIIGDCNTEAGEVKEGDNVKEIKIPEQDSDLSISDVLSYQDIVNYSKRRSLLLLFHEVSANYESRTRSSQSGAISSSVHDLSPTLWHALDVWRCVNQLSGGLSDALKSLGMCGMGLSTESWVDGICAIQVLADASKANKEALRVLQNLARGVQPHGTANMSSRTNDSDIADSADHLKQNTTDGGTESPSKISINTKPLSDIYEKTEPGSSPMKTATRADTESRHKSGNVHQHKPSTSKQTEFGKRLSTQESIRTDSRLNTGQTGMRPEVGTEVASGRYSQASSIQTYTNAVPENTPGLHGWHWEVAITYTDMLADICLHGSTSALQKMALIGEHKNTLDVDRVASMPTSPMRSAGLLDLVYFRAIAETSDLSSNDWSWRVRYSAIQGLVKICRCTAGDASKEGMRTVAWNTLLKANSLERDNRVLEALKVGQVDANIENLLAKHLAVPPSTIGAKMASGLSKLYLPPLPPPVEVKSSKKTQTSPTVKSPNVGARNKISQPAPKKPVRTALQEEIMLATALYEPPPAFEAKTGFDLRRVVEDQWRKQLQGELAEEEEERQKELQERQTEIENKEREIEEQRKTKLKSKYKGTKAYELPAIKTEKTSSKVISPKSSASCSKSRR